VVRGADPDDPGAVLELLVHAPLDTVKVSG
jgi:hypothetical protein